MTPRPRENAETFGRAAAAVADQILRKASGAIAFGEEAHQARDRLASVISDMRGELRQGGAHMAAKVAERAGFTTNDLVTELFEDFPSEMARVVAADVRAWVANDRPEAPFETAARVTVREDHVNTRTGLYGTVSGVAIRTARHDEAAYALLVTDAERATFVSSKGARGYRIIAWERPTSVAPLAEGDGELVEVTNARERRISEPVEPAGAPSPRRTREGASDGQRRVATAEPESRGAAVLALLDAAAEALRGTDEEAARSSVAALEAGLRTLRMLESGGPQAPLVAAGGYAPAP